MICHVGMIALKMSQDRALERLAKSTEVVAIAPPIAAATEKLRCMKRDLKTVFRS